MSIASRLDIARGRRQKPCIVLLRINGGRIETVFDPETEQPFVFPDLETAAANTRNRSIVLSGQAVAQIVELEI